MQALQPWITHPSAGTLAVTDAVTLSDNLTVAGTTTLDNASISGTLAVTDAVTLSDNLTVAGTTTLDNTSISGTLAVTDAVTLSDNLTVAGGQQPWIMHPSAAH